MSSDSVLAVPSGKSYFGATVLVCKLELGVFEEAVHQDDEFAQAGHQRHFGRHIPHFIAIRQNQILLLQSKLFGHYTGM